MSYWIFLIKIPKILKKSNKTRDFSNFVCKNPKRTSQKTRVLLAGSFYHANPDMLCFLFVMSFLSFTAQDLTKKFVRFQNKTESKETMKHWVLEPSRDRPYFFPFVQYVTKTRLHRSLPPEVTRSNPQIDVGKLKKLVSETG